MLLRYVFAATTLFDTFNAHHDFTIFAMLRRCRRYAARVMPRAATPLIFAAQRHVRR